MITVELKGVQEIQAKLQKACNVAGTKSVLEGVGDIVVDEIQRNFRNEGIGNRKWVRSKAAQAENRQTLTKTRALRRVKRSDFDGKQVLVGTSAVAKRKGEKPYPYGAALHYGTKNMPARPWLEVDEQGMKRIEEFLTDKIEDALKG